MECPGSWKECVRRMRLYRWDAVDRGRRNACKLCKARRTWWNKTEIKQNCRRSGLRFSRPSTLDSFVLFQFHGVQTLKYVVRECVEVLGKSSSSAVEHRSSNVGKSDGTINQSTVRFLIPTAHQCMSQDTSELHRDVWNTAKPILANCW